MKCNDDSCDLSHCSKCGCHMMGVYLEPGVTCDSCRQTLDYLGPRTPEQFKNVFCKLFPGQNKLEIWKGMDFLGYVVDENLTLFPSEETGFAEISFADFNIIMDNWNQMKELQHKTHTYPCPHCGFAGEHEMGPDDRSAICGSCDTPFNIACSGCGCMDDNHRIDCPNLETN